MIVAIVPTQWPSYTSSHNTLPNNHHTTPRSPVCIISPTSCQRDTPIKSQIGCSEIRWIAPVSQSIQEPRHNASTLKCVNGMLERLAPHIQQKQSLFTCGIQYSSPKKGRSPVNTQTTKKNCPCKKLAHVLETPRMTWAKNCVLHQSLDDAPRKQH